MSLNQEQIKTINFVLGQLPDNWDDMPVLEEMDLSELEREMSLSATPIIKMAKEGINRPTLKKKERKLVIDPMAGIDIPYDTLNQKSRHLKLLEDDMAMLGHMDAVTLTAYAKRCYGTLVSDLTGILRQSYLPFSNEKIDWAFADALSERGNNVTYHKGDNVLHVQVGTSALIL